MRHCHSYKPSPADIALEDSGAGETEDIFKYGVYRRMLADYFEESEETAIHRADEFERRVKERFVEEPGQMRLLIVVDKLLTGFDAPSATYLYIDKQMRDHGLFQAICRVNRLDGDDKEYGYVIDYKDLFHSLEGAITDYTSGALDGYDKEDVIGLLTNRLETARVRLEAARETVKALCEPVRMPRGRNDYFAYFSAVDSADAETMRANEPKRVALYKSVVALTRAYANIANEMQDAGYTSEEINQVKHEVTYYNHLQNDIKLHSSDYLDMKMFEPAMRRLLDSYIQAGESETLADFEELGLIELIVEKGLSALDQLPETITSNQEAMAETIENNVRRVIIDERPVNPRYFDHMSTLLEALIEERRQKALDYQVYLERVKALIDQIMQPESSSEVHYPRPIDTRAKQSLYDNLEQNTNAVLKINSAIHGTKKDDWIGNIIKEREVKKAVNDALTSEGVALNAAELDALINIIKEQDEYQ